MFVSWGAETFLKYSEADITAMLNAFVDDDETYGMVLRAKGIIAANDGTWIHFDMVPEEIDIRTGSAAITGKLCVIGAQLDEKGVAALFGV